MSGVVGRVFHEFAVTITVAILVSGFVSLTLTPMLCARILSRAQARHRQAGWFARASDAFVDGLLAGYRVSLDFVLRHRFVMLLLTFATGYRRGVALRRHSQGLLPRGGHRLPARHHRGAARHQLPRNVGAADRGESTSIESDPAVESVTSAVGFGGATNKGFLFMRLKDKDKRDSMEAVMDRLRAATATIPGIRTILMPVQNLDFTGGRIARAKYQYTLQSGDIDALYSKAPEMERAMANLPGLRDVNSDLQISNPQFRVDIDRDKAAAFGVTADSGAHRALQRLRHPADLDHLHRGRRLPGDPRGGRRVPGRSDARSAASASATPTRPARAARRSRDDAAHRRAAADQPPVAAAGGDDLVQSGARRVARPGDRGHPRGRAQGRICRAASSPASPATRSCSSRRSPARARCCSPR